MTSTFKPIPPPRPTRGNSSDLQAEFKKSRIYKALDKGDNLRLISVLIKGEDVSVCDPVSQGTYLHTAVSLTSIHTQDTFLPMIYTLSNYGAQVNAQDKHGRTALELAINKELCQIMVGLIRVGTDLTDRDYRAMILRLQSPYQDELLDTFEKYEPGLWGAVKKNNAGLVHMLINSWCRINTIRTNMTLTEFAKLKRKSAEIIATLEDFDSTMEFVHATLAGDKRRMVQSRMDPRGTDPYIMDISYQENWVGPLMPRSLRNTAEAMGHEHILHLIPQEEEQEEASGGEDNEDYFYSGNRFSVPDAEERLEDETTHSEYSESIPNSIDSLPVTRKTRNLGDSIQNAQASAMEYIQTQHYFHDELEEYPFEYLPVTVPQISERQTTMNWDDSSKSVKVKRKNKKRHRSFKVHGTTDEVKSKTCVIQ